MIGIIGAMEVEIELLKKSVDIISEEEKAGLKFIKGSYSNKDIVFVRSGIGKVNAAICTQILIDLFNVSTVINIGVAGALNKELDVLDVVISDELQQYDIDATEFGYKLGEIPGMKKSIFKSDINLSNKLYDLSKEIFTNEKTIIGKVLTGDVFVSSNERKEYLSEVFNGDCTEMEGASIAHSAYLNNIPFVIIRTISDKADGSANINYNEFVEKAAGKSSTLVLKLLESL